MNSRGGIVLVVSKQIAGVILDHESPGVGADYDTLGLSLYAGRELKHLGNALEVAQGTILRYSNDSCESGGGCELDGRSPVLALILPIISADQSLVALSSNVLVSPSAARRTSETSAFKEAGPRTSSSSPQEVIADAITADMAR